MVFFFNELLEREPMATSKHGKDMSVLRGMTQKIMPITNANQLEMQISLQLITM
jgi:hypothetical protein